MSDCGSESSWFESRYLPFMLWNIIPNKTTRLLYNKKVLFILKNIFILKNLFSNISENSFFLKKFILLICREIPKKDLFRNETVFKSMFYINKSNVDMLDMGDIKRKLYKGDYILTKNLFDCFLHINTWLPTNRIQPHHSFKTFYLYNSYLNVGYFNIRKVFTLWSNIIIFISNIFFYNIKFITFSNSYFKNEVFALNWKVISTLKASWRYTHTFIFFFKNKTTRYNKMYFDYLTRLSFRIAFIVDIYYCNRTIYYCDVFKIITIGAVPISSNLYTLCIALPSASNLIFSNYFFLRLLLKIKKNTRQQIFSQLSLNYNKTKYF